MWPHGAHTTHVMGVAGVSDHRWLHASPFVTFVPTMLMLTHSELTQQTKKTKLSDKFSCFRGSFSCLNMKVMYSVLRFPGSTWLSKQ